MNPLKHFVLVLMLFPPLAGWGKRCPDVLGELSGNVSPFAGELAGNTRAQYERYLAHTLKGLERMRGKNGLLLDTMLLGRDGKLTPRLKDKKTTSPTNIALDLILQTELSGSAEHGEKARATLTRVLETLEKLPFHEASGLFHSWYLTSGTEVTQKDVSSIDNLHLALALWTVARNFETEPLGQRAQALLSRMKFGAFVDKKRGVVGGNLKHEDGQWRLEDYRYDYFGAEARSIYSVGLAIGLFGKEAGLDPGQLTFEMANPGGRRILRTWDGGAFQLLLPKLLVNEELYSQELKKSFQAYGNFILAEGKRRGLPLPAGHSASAVDVDGATVHYAGQAGSGALGNRLVNHPFDETTVTLHAVMMAATTNPQAFASALANAEKSLPLFHPDLGFVDGVRVDANGARPLPVVLSLDKQMEALALFQILSRDGMSPTARALRNDEKARRALEDFYEKVDGRMRNTRTKN